jgi:RNA polymerase sigma-70 factor (ECF subfamily)
VSSPDTSIQGDVPGRFPSTQPGWADRFRDPSRPEYAATLQDLCRRYWRPVYAYARISWARSNEDAKDLTQAFFAWLLEGEPLRNYQSERGGFRPFLKTLLARFAARRHEEAGRIKRGGGRVFLPLDDAVLPPAAGDRPDEAFDRQWLKELLAGALDRIRLRFRGDRREIQFQVFEAHDLCDLDEPPSYAEIADRFQLRESQVRDYLATVRRDVRQEVRLELGRLTLDAAELEKEWKVLFAAPEAGG